jgi:hypothetical protein
MAWMRELDNKCRDCQKLATHEVFGKRNGTYGKFCKRCAEKRLNDLKEFESECG